MLLAGFLFVNNDMRYRDRLNEEGRRIRDRRIPRSALTSPAHSAFERLYQSGNDQALITVTGFDHAAFNCLLTMFRPWFNQHTPWTSDARPFSRLSHYTHGRRRIITARTCLGLVLAGIDSEELNMHCKVGLVSLEPMQIPG
jgi:hypothetical protein